jgi:hypothetical protein
VDDQNCGIADLARIVFVRRNWPTKLQSGFTAIALEMNASLLVINSEHYCVMVIVRAAVWLFAPVPLVDAVRVSVLDPAGVPEFAGLLLLPHEARLTTNNARAQML